MDEKLNIAVVGAGVAGITAACQLQNSHHVTLFEKNVYVGGHTHTVTIPGGDVLEGPTPKEIAHSKPKEPAAPKTPPRVG